MPFKIIYGIYGITNIASGKTYVGSGSILCRMSQHECRLRDNRHQNKKLQHSWNKHGADSFVFYVIEQCARELCIEREQIWMDRLTAVKNGFNIRPRAEGNLGHKWSAEAKARLVISPEKRARLSVALTGKVKTRETIEKLSAAGRRRSAELSVHFKTVLTGRKKSPEHREKLAAGNRARAKEPGFGEMVAATKRGKKRAPFSAEWRANMSKAHRGKKRGSYRTKPNGQQELSFA